MEFPVRYINGNYQVTILSDGTKIRYTPEDELRPNRPETIDINISNYCENNCPWCYINASKNGKHGDLNLKVFETIEPYTEIAVNYAKHPGLENFLEKMQSKRVISNITINQIDFNKDYDKLIEWQKSDLFHGLGISIMSAALYRKLKYLDNTVAHTIYGITPMNLYKWASFRFDKVLILGYKNKGRGKQIVPKNKVRLSEIFKLFKVVSFDNLGIAQSKVRGMVDDGDWANYFMGKEGSSSFYIDTVEAKFYESSVSNEKGFDINNKSAREIFSEVKNGN